MMRNWGDAIVRLIHGYPKRYMLPTNPRKPQRSVQSRVAQQSLMDSMTFAFNRIMSSSRLCKLAASSLYLRAQ